MEKSLSIFSPASRTAMNSAWAKSGVKPEEVYRILRIGQPGEEAMATSTSFRQWLWYIEKYRVKMGDDAITDLQIGTMLNKKVPYLDQVTLFQSVKEQLLKQDSNLIVTMLAENLQCNAFQRLIDMNATPARFEMMIDTPLSLLKKEDIRYRAVETFTLYFAAAKGGDAALKQVKMLLKNNDLKAAVDAAAGFTNWFLNFSEKMWRATPTET
ncbi:hypothetical protein PHYSODRAFT_299007 [Phytophthora sojae]|uniref:RXLR phytopathogen effector protein WY-domain domain-containing protein n=1 Tax=Phytophthora sojae (strain P6497) TaxID=1094619 RepID=G4ZA15_PHYSP|nr:hypothetical protein PHYSODRAFT_299007 [Phytophthora sojae]EGZ21154.1 hypothetical protein PHYSODRAFT_299007 [Phytophthora sojae]|eukprot:XP_009523871.1 hypothetical protein PHYSODRAFT_299007 [Phytophthora sojae]